MLNVETFKTAKPELGIPEITNIQYDLWLLNITLLFPKQHSPVYVHFQNVVGFRVLDERDLLEFWGSDVRAEGWLWQVNAGGWLALESTRSGFLSAQITQEFTEYMLLGRNECVSVIADTPPTITSLD